MNTYLKYKPAGVQLVAFMGLASAFIILNMALSTIFFSDLGTIMLDKNIPITTDIANRFKLAQLVGATVTFVLPALCFGYFSSPDMFSYVGMHRRFYGVFILLAIALFIVVQPFAGWLGNLNAQMNFGSMQQALEDTENMYNRVLDTFLQMNSPKDLAINLIIMALLPALGEELFFRGGLQQVLFRLTKSPWVSIAGSTLIFALLHGTVFKFLPILFLGALLGTVYYLTRNLWYNVIIHFINNAFAVLVIYYADKNTWLHKLANDDISIPVYVAAISLALVSGILYMMKRFSKTLPIPIEVPDEKEQL